MDTPIYMIQYPTHVSIFHSEYAVCGVGSSYDDALIDMIENLEMDRETGTLISRKSEAFVEMCAKNKNIHLKRIDTW